MKLKYISGIVLTSVLLVACGNSDESKEDKKYIFLIQPQKHTFQQNN